MNEANLAAGLLRARLLLLRSGPAACAAVVLCLLGAAALAWLLPQLRVQAQLAARPIAAPPALAATAPKADANQNLALFYATLGERRYAEQQVKTLFALAAKTGLSLKSGEYKSSYDKASRVSSYQVVLPVKGTYQAIWQFSLQALSAIPFAALDDISFKRETIADNLPEARLSMTFYLKDAGVAP
ncbi:MAG TPA: hypothetical protein VGP06_02500 [Janthinobacterium sp.]|jgi:hypothetical protein|nr:hypothetical protein [Janthinobacterium sp.]